LPVLIYHEIHSLDYPKLSTAKETESL